MLKRLITLLLLLSVLAPASASAQSCDGALTWNGIVPDCLSVGDTYRIMFITSGTRDAEAVGIGTYNAFVQGEANVAPFTDAGIVGSFRAVVSTLAQEAHLNTESFTPLNIGSNGPGNLRGSGTFRERWRRGLIPDNGQGEPIFYFNGRKIADNYPDFWDDDWDTLEGRDADGNVVGNMRVWSGSRADGRARNNGFWLGDINNAPTLSFPIASFGESGNADNHLERNDLIFEPTTTSYRFYALSGVLTVPLRVSLSELSSATLSEGPDDTSATLTVNLTANAPTDLTVLIDITQTTPSETPPGVTYALDYGVAIVGDAANFSFDSANPAALRTRRVVVPFAAGQSSRTLELTALDDVDTLSEDLSIELADSDDYSIDATAAARTLTLEDDDAPTVSLNLISDTLSEGSTSDSLRVNLNAPRPHRLDGAD